MTHSQKHHTKEYDEQATSNNKKSVAKQQTLGCNKKKHDKPLPDVNNKAKLITVKTMESILLDDQPLSVRVLTIYWTSKFTHTL